MDRWLIHAKRWAQNPPSMGRVKLIAAILLFCLSLAAYERFFGWPDALTTNHTGRGRIAIPTQ